MTMRTLLSALLALLLASPFAGTGAQGAEANAISDGVVRIGLILDLSGPFSDTAGAGNIAAAKMAVEDFGGKVLDAPIEVVAADHQNNTDRAAAIARDWFVEQRVDAIVDVAGSSEALIVQAIANTRHKILIVNSAAAARLSNEACTPTSIHYVSNTHAIANTVGTTLVARGGRSWFFITVDNSFGYDLESDLSTIVTARGGEILGHARHPLDAGDYSAYLARAKQSQAKVIALANGGRDLDQTLGQAAKLGMIPGPQTFASPTLRLTGINALGLGVTQGLMLSESFYWDLDDATRAWSKRYFERTQKMPNSLQAGLYSSTMHYLKAVARAGTDATDAVMKEMRAARIDDFFAHYGYIRSDGVMVHDLRLFQVKTPAQSHAPWDYYQLVATIPGDQAFGPLAQSKCPLVER